MRKKSIIAGSIFIILFWPASFLWPKTLNFSIENSPYLIEKTLIVEKNDVFTAEPGVVIEMAKNAKIIIKGKIDICGYPKGGEVIFKAVGPYQNYHKGFWGGIVIKSKEKNKISYAVIQHSRVGIKIEKGAFAEITNNIITQNKTGVKIENAKNFILRRNSFLGNFTDIEAENSSGKIDGNFFQGSLVVIKLKNAYPEIENNYIKQAYKDALLCDNAKSLKLGKNWWGSSKKEKVKSLIIQEGEGAVSFEPFLKKAPDLRQVGVDLKE